MTTMPTAELPPYLLFFLAAALLPLLPSAARRFLPLAIPLLSGALFLNLEAGSQWQTALMGFEITPVRVDTLSLLFVWLFHIASFIAFIFALNVTDRVQQSAALTYVGSALGAVMAGDLLTLFVFWELLAVSSVFLIWSRRSPRAWRSGQRYLIIQVTSGVLLLAGALMRFADQGTLTFDALGLTGTAHGLIFLAFGIKSAFPLAHNWLTDAYPEATPTGTVFLSAFTTKVAIYALARGFAGTELLIYIGAVMTCFPIFYAVIENDLRRVLAYSMINQLGFMVCGIGLGTAMAVNGAVAHAFNDVLFKGLLFMSMGAVLHRTGRMNGSDLGGLYKSMPKTTVLCIVGAASISAFPLFSGFVSKSLIMSEAALQGYTGVWLMLLFASAGVFHHAGIKIPFFAFFAHDSGIRTREAPVNMLLAMSIAAAFCIGIGVYPWLLYDMLPHAMEYNPFESSHVLAQYQLLLFSALAFAWLKLSGLYPPELRSVNLDVEWLYRRVAPRVVQQGIGVTAAAAAGLRDASLRIIHLVIAVTERHHGPESFLARSWSTGSTVLWISLLLGIYLIFYYV